MIAVVRVVSVRTVGDPHGMDGLLQGGVDALGAHPVYSAAVRAVRPDTGLGTQVL